MRARPGVPFPGAASCLDVGYRLSRKTKTFQGRTPMTTMTRTAARTRVMSGEEKFVIFASSLGTVLEWYDFYLYAILAPFFAALFFPSGNDTAALLSVCAICTLGFLGGP